MSDNLYDNKNGKHTIYHTVMVDGHADHDYVYTHPDGTKINVKKGDLLVTYSNGSNALEILKPNNMRRHVPFEIYRKVNHPCKDYLRYYVPVKIEQQS